MAWLSASLFLLPVMKLRVVRGIVDGRGMVMETGTGNGAGGFVGGGNEGGRGGGWFDDKCG